MPLYSKPTRNNLDIIEQKQIRQRVRSKADKKVNEMKLNSVNVNTEINMQSSKQETIEAIKITTIVEIMRNKTKDKENKILLRSKRETSRSLSIVAKPRNLTGEVLSPTLLRNFYGLPRITIKEPQISSEIKNPVQNFGLKENINDLEMKSIPVPHPFSFLPLPLSAYNDSAAREIDDLNISQPIQRQSKRIKTLSGVDIRFPLISTTPKPPKTKKQRQTLKKPDAPLLQDSTNSTYINIQDHRKNLLKESEKPTVPGLPADIAPYNPDIIPYVDVPDYSDRREESLDENDRKMSKSKFKNYDDQDFVDPLAPGEISLNKKSLLNIFIERFFNQLKKMFR